MGEQLVSLNKTNPRSLLWAKPTGSFTSILLARRSHFFWDD
jgi:hypothetical protein